MRLFDVVATKFENFDDTMRSYLQKALASIGVNYKSSQIFGVLLNGIKGVMQNVMFYIEDAFTEQNVFTAVRKKSIFNLAKISGYTPYYGCAAVGTAVISVIAGNENVYSSGTNQVSKLYISDGLQLRDTNTGLVYTISMPVDEYVVDVSKPLVQHEFKIIEGTYYYSQYTAAGYLFETFDVGVNGLWDDNYIQVTVNGEEYSRVASIYEASAGDKAYVLRNGYDSLFSVSFGNGTYGKCLSEGDTVRVKYLKHNGTSGNVALDNIYDGRFMFDTMVSDAKGNYVNAANYLNIEINNSVSGGSDADTIREVKNAIGAESRSLVYVTPENFMLFMKRFPFVGWCNVVTKPNSLSVTGMCLKNTDNIVTDASDYYNITKDDLLLTDTEKEMMLSSLENSGKLFAGIQFSLEDPVVREFAAVCYVKLTGDTVNRDAATERIRNVFADYFMSISKSKLYIPKTAIIVKIMDSCSDIIESADFDFISETNETAYKNGYYTRYVQDKDGSFYTASAAYEPSSTVFIDDFGNIQLDSELETCLLHGGFKYYPDKNGSSADSVTLSHGVQVYFI